MSEILLFILLLCLVIIITYWLWFYISFQKLSYHHKKTNAGPTVSVIVCYQNEGDHILKTINAILQQNYENFEILAMDDFSTDDGPKKLSEIDDPRLKLMSAEKNLQGKKAALTQAITAASNEFLLFTDADCLPASSHWISAMVYKMTANKHTEIVLGYGPVIKKTGWVNTFARFETVLTAIQYISYASSGIPYMGVGRNLMYRKSLFEKTGGFESHSNIASGDDDLMISAAGSKNNTAVCVDPDTFMFSDAKNTILKFLNQKSRHVSTSLYYSFLHKFLLSVFALTHMLFYSCLVFSFIYGWLNFSAILTILFLKWAIQILFQKQAFKILNGKDLMYRFPLLDILLVLYYYILPIFTLIRKNGW